MRGAGNRLPRPRVAGERVGERGRALGVILVALSLFGGCGYHFAAGGRLTGGIESASVLPFENLSTQPELGAVLAAALREELAARGALARTEGGAVVAGEVSATVPSPSASGGVSWRFALEVRARLLQGDRVVAERKLRREVDYPAGLDALETEGRRAQASRRLAADMARELVATLME
jgi:hypothetical protein